MTNYRLFRLLYPCVFVFFCPLLSATDPSIGDSISMDDSTRTRCLEILHSGLESEEFWPSMHAAEALTLAGLGEEVRRFLEPKLPLEKDSQHLCGLAREIVRAGDRSRVEILLEILDGADPHGHVHAAESLYKVDEVGSGRELLKAFDQSGNETLKLISAAALAKWGSPTAIAFLRLQVGVEESETARIAAWILGQVGNESDIPLLKSAMNRFSDDLTLAFFEHAIALLGDKEGQSALIENLSHKDPTIRAYAATFAGEARMVASKDRLTALLDDLDLDVRVRSAQSLMVLSRPAPHDSHEDLNRDVFVATESHPRYSEGSVIHLRDGKLLFATTEFIGNESDFASARIVAMESTDQGRTWTSQRVLQENTGLKNVMSVTLRRLENPEWAFGPLGLFYLKKNTFEDLRVFLRISHDEGRTFGEEIEVSRVPGYHVMNNDRVTLLSSGRLLAPVATTEDVEKVNHFVCHCFYSDDAGKTWRASEGGVDYPQRGAMEPEVFELENGRVLMIFRTQIGHIGASYSEDGGMTWSDPESWGVVAPESPATLRRIPSTGDLLLIWNDHFEEGAGHGGKRTPLTSAISEDEGKTWKHKRNLEDNPGEDYAYTSLIFAQGRAVLSYYVQEEGTTRILSRFRSLPIEWFYEKE